MIQRDYGNHVGTMKIHEYFNGMSPWSDENPENSRREFLHSSVQVNEAVICLHAAPQVQLSNDPLARCAALPVAYDNQPKLSLLLATSHEPRNASIEL